MPILCQPLVKNQTGSRAQDFVSKQISSSEVGFAEVVDGIDFLAYLDQVIPEPGVQNIRQIIFSGML